MSLDSLSPVNFPNSKLGGADTMELVIEEFTGMVEGTIQRRSVMSQYITPRTVRGTSTLTNYAVGEAELGKIDPEVTPQSTAPNQFSNNHVTIDTTIYARNIFPLLDVFQTQFDARQEVATEQGKKIAKFYDNAYFTMAAKAAAATVNSFGAVPGFAGGTTIEVANSTDAQVLYKGIAQMFAEMETKDVIPNEDDVVIALRPDAFYNLLQAEQIVNGTYVTAKGTKIDGGFIFKAFGCPVVRSNNIPSGNVTGHLLSNARNGNAYDGDFTKLVATAFSPRALLAGETISLQKDIFFDKVSKSWYVDSWFAFGVAPNRNEYAGRLVLA